MKRLMFTGAAALTVVLAEATKAAADNCSGPQDCYGSVRSAVAATVGMALLIAVTVLVLPGLARTAAIPLRRSSQPKGDDGGADPGAAETPEPEGNQITIDEKVRADLAVRGWTEAEVDHVIRQPRRTETSHDRRVNLDGTQENAPGALYVDADDRYVMLNRVTLDVIQISGAWASRRPQPPADPEGLAARIAAESGAVGTLQRGREYFYKVDQAYLAVNRCELNRITILGLDGFVNTNTGLRARLDLILDCSIERQVERDHQPPVALRADAARQTLRRWAAIDAGLYVSITMHV